MIARRVVELFRDIRPPTRADQLAAAVLVKL